MVVDRIKYFEQKYWLQSQAIDVSNKSQALALAVDKIKNVYRNRISHTKDEVLQLLASAGDLFSKNLLADMFSLVADVDKLIRQPTQDSLLLELANVRKDITDNKQKVREAFHNSFRIRRDSDKNRREHQKQKLDLALTEIERVMIESAALIEPYCTSQAIQLTRHILSGKVKPKRKELSKQNLLDFSRRPEAERYGINSLDILEKLLKLPIREQLTTLINAINRGENPQDGPAVLLAAHRAAQQLAREKPRPDPFHELPEEEAQKEMRTDILDPSQQWSRQMQDLKKEKGEERLEEEEAELTRQRLVPVMQQRDLEYQQRQKKLQEEALLNKYNSLSLLLSVMNKMASKYHI